MSHLVLGSNTNIVFKVKRVAPELIRPAKPTPRELKLLSDIDDQEGLRFYIPGFLIYRSTKTDMNVNRDKNHERRQPHPAEVIRAAVAEALVYYYPWAGRLTEVGDKRKLAVDCTGEGVLFIKAEAEVSLEEFGAEICPPFPCYEELLFNPPGSSSDIVDSPPLVFIQVTHLLCGGLIIGFSMNHTISDGGGMIRFMKVVADIVKGEPQPPPLLMLVWNRELLIARDPPDVTCKHCEYDPNPNMGGRSTTNILVFDQMVRCFFFGPKEVSALRRFIPQSDPDLPVGRYSTFDVLAACLWRCHTISLGYDPDEEVRALLTVNFRSKINPPLPSGYYGNEFAYSAAITTEKKISENPPAYAWELIRTAKDAITEEHLRSLLDFLVTRGRPKFTMHNTFLVSDLRRSGFSEVDFGWGKPVYAGPTNPRITSFIMSYENNQGIEGILVPVVLPPDAMGKFIDELGVMLKDSTKLVAKTSCLF